MSQKEDIADIQAILKRTSADLVVDGLWGKKSQAALERLVNPAHIISPGWGFTVRIDGDDLCVDNARATCFGGSDDPQDNGDTASGISTKKNPGIQAVSLPMDFGDKVPNTKGSPIPKLPWNTEVRVECISGPATGVQRVLPVIDIGPAKRTGNAIDLTIAAARLFNPHATARNFEMRCSYRILGGAKFLPRG